MAGNNRRTTMKTRYRLAAAILATTILMSLSTPLGAKERKRESQKIERTDTPYSNRSVRRDREARRQSDEAEKKKRPDYYQFKRRDN
jgi:hypothetical protein